MGQKSTFHYGVLVQDTDFSQRMNLVSIGNMLMNAAGTDAENKGFGMKALRDKNLAWVAMRIYIKIHAYPAMLDTITIQTWIENSLRMTTQRNCTIYDGSGNLCAEITSLWTIIDFTTRQPASLQDCLPAYSDCILPESLPIHNPGKVLPLKNGEKVGTHTVVYSDIDGNMHATSFKYVSWVLDTIPLDVFQKSMISEFEVNFVHECRFGDTVEIYREQIAENICSYEVRSLDGAVLNRCKLTFSSL